MSRKVLTPGNVEAIKRMRAVKNEWGDPRFTGAEIAVELGVSESTVWRVVREQAAYKKRELPTREMSQDALEEALVAVRGNAGVATEEAQSSLARFTAAIAAEKTKQGEVRTEHTSDAVKTQAALYLEKT